MTMPRFVVPISILPGESLAGVVARAAHENMVTTPHSIFPHLNMPLACLGSLATRYSKQCDELAYFMGVDPNILSTLFYGRVDRHEEGLGAEIDFFGCRLASRCREKQIRRLSPESLRVSPHHRAAWEVKFIHWCPESFEYLLSKCSACGKNFGWGKFAGIHICENCGADIREQTSEFVHESEREMAQLLSDFILDREAAMRLRTSLHEDLRYLADADILRIALMLSSGFDWSSNVVNNALCNSDRKSAPSLQSWRRGFSLIRNWPESAYEIIWMNLEVPDEDICCGRIRKLGPVASHLMAPNTDLTKLLKKVLEGSFSRKGLIASHVSGNCAEWYRPGWLPSIEAKKKHKLTSWTIEQALRYPEVRTVSQDENGTSQDLLHEEDLLGWLEKLKEALDVPKAMRCIGVPEHSVWELLEFGHLKFLTSEIRVLNPRRGFIDASSVKELGEALLNRCLKPANEPQNLVALSEAVKLPRSPISPWTTAIRAILNGELNVWRQDGQMSAYADALLVKPEEFEIAIDGNIEIPEFLEAPILMTYNNAADLLQTSSDTVVQLAKEQKIESEFGGAGRRAVRRSVYCYALSRDRAAGTPHDV
jgi:hypothetical protein